MKGIVDRIEDSLLILEVDNSFVEIDIKKFPANIKEGDLVVKKGDNYEVLDKESADARKNIKTLLTDFFPED